MAERYAIARLIGRLTHAPAKGDAPTLILIGPGRWGTSTPALGIPVSFAEIETVSILCEVASMREGLVPDLSLGTHFLNDLVELDILCMAIEPQREGDILDDGFFAREPNILTALVPNAAPFADAVKVIDAGGGGGSRPLLFAADVTEQEGICFVQKMP